MRQHASADSVFSVGTGKTPVPATIYFFNLDLVLSHLGSSRLTDPSRLHAICTRHVKSIIGSDLLLFSEHGFYLVISSCTGPAADSLAEFINVSLLTLLFGTEKIAADRRLRLYRTIEPEDLPAVSTHKIAELAKSIVPHEAYDFEDLHDEHPSATERLEQLARDGVDVEQGVELTFFPVHDLRRAAVSALFCAPTFAGAEFGHAAFRDIGASELPYIDRAILQHGLSFAQRLAEAGIVVAVGVPVSFETLAWSKSRQIFQGALRAANLSQNPQLILKIEDIPPGTPAERIAQLMSGLRAFVRHIFIHLPDNHVELVMAGRMGASGLVKSLQRRAALPEVLADSKWLSRAAHAQGAMSCIDHVESDEALAVVRSADIRFAVGHVFGAETLRGTAPMDEVRDVLEQVGQATAAHLRAVA